ncbi:MAG: glycosyltransferase family 39 protein [Candidatus Bathyarchaeota archaeon]|nr:glycosyltransferase family 39 protein [Candidatus Bathyarchaeota archaeon]
MFSTEWVRMFSKQTITRLFRENYPLILILAGTVLVSASIGPYRNGDTRLEYAAATGVVNWGMPYAYSIPNIIDEPPLGFYTSGLIFKIFGLSVENGVALVTLFGLGCTMLIYKFGKDFYSKTAGVFAAALFALSPWEFVLTRSFLIDTQCLFLSLLTLYVGVLAIRRDSVKLTAVAGIFFALALLTKLYAAFVLIPLLLLYLHHRPKNPKQILSQLAVFCFPTIYLTFLWYQLVLQKGFLYIIQHGDFSEVNVAGVVPSYTFVSTFLVNFALGLFFVVAAIFSLVLTFVFRKRFSKFLLFDMVCLISIAVIVGVDAFLAVNQNLKVPYTSAVKYLYQALPFFSLVAGSLAAKSVSFLSAAKNSLKPRKIMFIILSAAGIILLAVAIFSNINFVHQMSTHSYVVFEVKLGTNFGYSLFNRFPITQNSPVMHLQYVGFTLVLGGLLSVGGCRLLFSLQSISRWMKKSRLA